MPTASETLEAGQPSDAHTERRLYRSQHQRVLAGVCGGLGEYFAVDPVWFRIAFIVLALGGGSGVLVYLLMWLIIPRRPENDDPPATGRAHVSGVAVIGLVLMFVGSIALVNTVAPWLGQYAWPVVFILGGFALMIGGFSRDNDR